MKNYIIIALVAIIAAPTAYGVGKTIEARVQALERQIVELEARIKAIEPKRIIVPPVIKPKPTAPKQRCFGRFACSLEA